MFKISYCNWQSKDFSIKEKSKKLKYQHNIEVSVHQIKVFYEKKYIEVSVHQIKVFYEKKYIEVSVHQIKVFYVKKLRVNFLFLVKFKVLKDWIFDEWILLENQIFYRIHIFSVNFRSEIFTRKIQWIISLEK